jgi:transposase
MEENKEEDALKEALWELGLTDRQIASVFNVDIDTITDWRTNFGLDRNQVGIKDILNEKNSENKQKMALWELGLTDQQLADIFLVSKSSIYLWRKKNELQCNDKRKEPRLEKEDFELRLKLFNENYSDEEIAIVTGLSKESITMWRWKNNLSKGKRNSEKIEELSEKESLFLEYLRSKYPERSDAFCIALARYVEPKVGFSPSAQQREFVRKIKLPGFKTIYYYDDGEYTNLNEAIDLFIRLHPYIEKNISKLQSIMGRELYEAFLKHKYPDIRDTQINPDERIRISITLDPESIEIIDKSRDQQSRSAYINELIHAYGNGQE